MTERESQPAPAPTATPGPALPPAEDACPTCGEALIPLQRGSSRWSCVNNHTVERAPRSSS